MIANDVLELVGNTPLVRMDFLGKNYATVLAKLEYFNPSGSVKDRTAKYLIEYAEASGKIDKNKEILEASSGNFGVSLAMIAAVKGYKVTIVLPENSSLIKKRLIEAFGGKIIFSPADKGTAGAIELKKKLLKKYPKKYIDINQFENPANILAHYYTTGKELIEQTHGKIDMIIVGIGTGGTGMGVSMAVKSFNPSIKVIGVMPAANMRIEGLRNLKDKDSSRLFKRNFFDEIREIKKGETSQILEVAREVAKKKGILLGPSGSVVMYVAMEKAKILGKGKNIVAIIADNGVRYMW